MRTDSYLYLSSIEDRTVDNDYFRKILYQNGNMQLVAQSLDVGETVDSEVHRGDQFFMVEKGQILIELDNIDTFVLIEGSAIVVPAGTVHFVKNNGTQPAKFYTIYSPPNDPPDVDSPVKTNDSTCLFETDFQGIPVHIENPAGSMRQGTDASGNKWQSTFTFSYGYLRGVDGHDGDEMDCFIGHNKESRRVYVIYQTDGHRKFDEHKCMLGFNTLLDAKVAYLAHYQTPAFLGRVEEMTLEQFKRWIESKSPEGDI